LHVLYDIMKFIEKERTLDQRESLSLSLWMIILCIGAVAFILVMQDMCLVSIPVILILLFVLKLELRNNKLMAPMAKKRKRERK